MECRERTVDFIGVVVCDVVFRERFFTEIRIALFRLYIVAFCIGLVYNDRLYAGFKLSEQRVSCDGDIDAVSSICAAGIWQN